MQRISFSNWLKESPKNGKGADIIDFASRVAELKAKHSVKSTKTFFQAEYGKILTEFQKEFDGLKKIKMTDGKKVSIDWIFHHLNTNFPKKGVISRKHYIDSTEFRKETGAKFSRAMDFNAIKKEIFSVIRFLAQWELRWELFHQKMKMSDVLIHQEKELKPIRIILNKIKIFLETFRHFDSQWK